MAKTRSQLNTEAVHDPIVRVRVTRRGHGKISTGVHDNVHGDFLYEKDEEFEIARSIALNLIGEDKIDPDNTKDWVEIIGEVKARDPLDHDGGEVRRGPGRPPKAAE